jgi:hypothetical protein
MMGMYSEDAYCINCGKHYTKKNPRQKSCSKKCQKGIRTSKKYSSRYGVDAHNHYVLRRIEKATTEMHKELETQREK